ncbi:MAG TPA: T9SS type A sorting domain-containing protein, partial [Chitinophagaceae bacterium]|nr:T9SS type A sorting domain-containing protein [Chitinophagaceae bacterium]
FRPHFTEDGNDYVLTVRAKDKSGNTSSNNAYKVRFEVVNKPMISSVINYPNPFTTSTQFIFTITGSQIPSNLKIQILSPTGKVVREIVKSELGNLHIGRNITEFKWKGDDQFGQPLGNGVYLYRFITNLNGNKMDHYNTGADKWIDKGFGKLYIMR